MRSFNRIQSDQTQNRIPLLLIALWFDLSPFAGRHLIAINLYAR
jgi:hypothetical protein